VENVLQKDCTAFQITECENVVTYYIIFILHFNFLRNHWCSVQRNNRDFLHPIRFLLRYKLTDVEQPTMRPGDPLPDLNLYPIINDSLSQIHYSVNSRY